MQIKIFMFKFINIYIYKCIIRFLKKKHMLYIICNLYDFILFYFTFKLNILYLNNRKIILIYIYKGGFFVKIFILFFKK